MNKRKLYQWCKKYIIADNVRIVLLFIPLTYLLVKLCVSGQFSWDNYLDTSVLVSFVLVFFCEGIAKLLSLLIGRHCEDATKLTEDYDKLCKKYSREKGFVVLGEKKCPVICLCLRKQREAAYSFLIQESKEGKRYELPTQVAEKADIIMGAHGYSDVYNNRNIRLDDLSLNEEKNEVTLSYSTTMYFDSLVTNRAMDYDWGNGKTVREVYEPGPFLSTLKESKLSNHLGFNGFVETDDGQIIFVMRYGKVSIGKRTLGDSIGASLKTAYCLDDDKNFTLEGLERAIRGEIKNELKIVVREDAKLCEGIFAFYRDVVEGGKPQFLFYYKTELKAEQIEKGFEIAIKEDRKKKNGPFLTDGKKLLFIPRSELKELQLTPGGLERKSGKRYRMMPSAVASVEMLKEFLGSEDLGNISYATLPSTLVIRHTPISTCGKEIMDMSEKDRFKEYKEICKKIEGTEYTLWKSKVEEELDKYSRVSLENMLKKYSLKEEEVEYNDSKDDIYQYNSSILTILLTCITVLVTLFLAGIAEMSKAVSADKEYSQAMGSLVKEAIIGFGILFLVLLVFVAFIYVVNQFINKYYFRKRAYYKEMVGLIKEALRKNKLSCTKNMVEPVSTIMTNGQS